MFFDLQLLCKKGKFAVCWIAATFPEKRTKLSRTEKLKFNVISIADEIIKYVMSDSTRPENRISLRLSAHLAYGLIWMYNEKINMLKHDICNIYVQLYKPKVLLEIRTKKPTRPSKKIVPSLKPATIPAVEETALVTYRDATSITIIDEPAISRIRDEEGIIQDPEGFLQELLQISQPQLQTTHSEEPLRRVDVVAEVHAPPQDLSLPTLPNEIIVSVDVHAPPRDLPEPIPTISIDLCDADQNIVLLPDSSQIRKRKRSIEDQDAIVPITDVSNLLPPNLQSTPLEAVAKRRRTNETFEQFSLQALESVEKRQQKKRKRHLLIDAEIVIHSDELRNRFSQVAIETTDLMINSRPQLDAAELFLQPAKIIRAKEILNLFKRWKKDMFVVKETNIDEIINRLAQRDAQNKSLTITDMTWIISSSNIVAQPTQHQISEIEGNLTDVQFPNIPHQPVSEIVVEPVIQQSTDQIVNDLQLEPLPDKSKASKKRNVRTKESQKTDDLIESTDKDNAKKDASKRKKPADVPFQETTQEISVAPEIQLGTEIPDGLQSLPQDVSVVPEPVQQMHFLDETELGECTTTKSDLKRKLVRYFRAGYTELTFDMVFPKPETNRRTAANIFYHLLVLQAKNQIVMIKRPGSNELESVQIKKCKT